MCDTDLLFMYVAVAGPGKINDSRAFSRCTGLIEWFVTLPDWCFVSADNAYPPTQKMLVPHNATELLIEYRRTYNFSLSQLRIRIEMAFVVSSNFFRSQGITIFTLLFSNNI